ncbi:MAG: hypothetical protein RML45_14670 [Acetobacteraceae bacterium]|nr:hypothetical protein [Acetobacteraceae bacterium]
MPAAMWNEPYLETCCRSALHRLRVAGRVGRPPAMKDGPCLLRLAGMGFCRERSDGWFEITAEGIARHRSEILKKVEPSPA